MQSLGSWRGRNEVVLVSPGAALLLVWAGSVFLELRLPYSVAWWHWLIATVGSLIWLAYVAGNPWLETQTAAVGSIQQSLEAEAKVETARALAAVAGDEVATKAIPEEPFPPIPRWREKELKDWMLADESTFDRAGPAAAEQLSKRLAASASRRYSNRRDGSSLV